MKKDEARSFVKKSFQNIPDRIQKEESIRNHFSDFVGTLKNLIVYYPVGAEINPFPDWVFMIGNKMNGKSCYFPKIINFQKKTMVFVLPEEGFHKNQYHIPEPIGSKEMNPESADCILIPSLGLNDRGFRLGTGAGFYDRALAGIDSNKLIGFSFDEIFPLSFQEEVHDIRVGKVITEKRIIITDYKVSVPIL